QDEHERETAARELEPGEAVAGHRAEHQVRDDRDARDDHRVEQPAQRLGLGEQVAVALDVQAGGYQLGRELVDLGAAHERGEDHLHERQYEDQRERHQQQMPGAEREFPAHAQNTSDPRRRLYRITTRLSTRVTMNNRYAAAAPYPSLWV